MAADAVAISARRGRLPRPRLVAAEILMQRPYQTRGSRPELLRWLGYPCFRWGGCTCEHPVGEKAPGGDRSKLRG
jgi:hypothetical protein